MKRAQIISLAVLVLALLVMGGNALSPLPDWDVRVDGVVLLCALPAAAFAAVRGRMDR